MSSSSPLYWPRLASALSIWAYHPLFTELEMRKDDIVAPAMEHRELPPTSCRVGQLALLLFLETSGPDTGPEGFLKSRDGFFNAWSLVEEQERTDAELAGSGSTIEVDGCGFERRRTASKSFGGDSCRTSLPFRKESLVHRLLHGFPHFPWAGLFDKMEYLLQKHEEDEHSILRGVREDYFQPLSSLANYSTTTNGASSRAGAVGSCLRDVPSAETVLAHWAAVENDTTVFPASHELPAGVGGAGDTTTLRQPSNVLEPDLRFCRREEMIGRRDETDKFSRKNREEAELLREGASSERLLADNPTQQLIFSGPHVENGILPCEARFFLHHVELAQCDTILESGINNGGSTEYLCHYAALRRGNVTVLSVDRQLLFPAERLCERYRRGGYRQGTTLGIQQDFLRVFEGDSFRIIPELLEAEEKKGRKTCLFLDGPKGQAAVRWAEELIDSYGILLVGFHDMHEEVRTVGYGADGRNLARVRLERNRLGLPTVFSEDGPRNNGLGILLNFNSSSISNANGVGGVEEWR